MAVLKHKENNQWVEVPIGNMTGMEVGDTEPTNPSVEVWIDTSDTSVIADYIVEQGTSGIWTYRKWNSGIMEEWGIFNIKGTWSSWGSLYYINQPPVNFAIPFVSVPVVNAFATATAGINLSSILCVGSYNASTEAEKKSACNIALYRATAGTNDVNYPVSVYAIGRWK